MSKEKLTNQLKKAYKSLEEEFKNKGRPNTIEDNNVDYDNCNIYAMRQKISDLEAKLAESEKSNEYFADRVEKADKEIKENYRNYNKLVEEYNELKQQLAENEEEIKVIDEDRQFKAEMWTKFADKCKELEKQLAEKDAEIEQLKSMAERSSSILDRFNYCGESIIYNTTREQDKISFAVEQLNQAKSKIQHNILFVNCDDYVNVIEEIDNQIKQLKEGM